MLVGLVGKPSVGKSTFFKAATLADVEIASYPFTTIKPNHGVGYVKVDCIEKEFNTKCNPAHGFCIEGKRFVPIEIKDVAGLVKGASEGKGLGNQFLDDLREADAFIHIVDVSGTTDEEGRQTEGYDPIKDIKLLDDELDAWYYGILIKVWKGFARKAEVEKSKFEDALVNQFSGLKVNEWQVKQVIKELGVDITKDRPSGWPEQKIRDFASHLRKITKPMIIAANKVDLAKGRENYDRLRADFPKLLIVPCSADLELALREAAKHGLIKYIPGERDFEYIDKGKLNERQIQALESIKKNVLEKYEEGTGVQSVLNNAVFKLLKYIAVFPASANRLTDSKGRVLPDCFLLPEGSTALDFAYTIHTDLGKNFIKAIDAKSKQAKGKDYVLKHRDAMEIVTK